MQHRRRPSDAEYSDKEVSFEPPKGAGLDTERDKTSLIVVGKSAEVAAMVRKLLGPDTSQASLARAIGIHPSVLSRFLSGALKGLRESAVQALVDRMATTEDKIRFRKSFLRPSLVKQLREWRKDQRSWVEHQLRSFQSRDFRRRIRVDAPKGWRHVPADSPAALKLLAKDIAEVSNAAEKVLFERVDDNPIRFLALLHGDFFPDVTNPHKYFTGSHIGRIVFVRWLRILQPFLNADASNGIDPSWREMPRAAFGKAIIAAWEREIGLILHSPLYGPRPPDGGGKLKS